MAETKTNPYPGPRPFSSDEFKVFAGRDYEISELCSLIVAHQAVVLYGESGAGKSSLLSAGIFPTLKGKEVDVLPVSRVGIPVPQSIELDQISNVYMYSTVRKFFPEVSDQREWIQNATLTEALARIPIKTDETGENLLRLVTFDQFEELFTKYPERWQNRINFFEQVHEALQADRTLRVLFVFREDYLASFENCSSLLPEKAHTRYRLERLRKPEALDAITRPLDGTQWSFDVNVAEMIVNNLMQVPVEDYSHATKTAKTMAGEFVEPVQLQVVCFNLLDRLPPSKTRITQNDLAEFGDPDEALQRFYQSAIKEVVLQVDIPEEELRIWFEKYLITPAGTRGLVYQDSLTTGDIPNEIVNKLEDRHLIRPEVRSSSRWYELSHDRFIEPIRKSNRAWHMLSDKLQHIERIGSMARKVSSLWFILLALVWSVMIEALPAENQILNDEIVLLKQMWEREKDRTTYYKRLKLDDKMHAQIAEAVRSNNQKSLESIIDKLKNNRRLILKDIQNLENPPFSKKEISRLYDFVNESKVEKVKCDQFEASGFVKKFKNIDKAACVQFDDRVRMLIDHLEAKAAKKNRWIENGLREPGLYTRFLLPIAWLMGCASLVLFLAYNTWLIRRLYKNVRETVIATPFWRGSSANDSKYNPGLMEPIIQISSRIESFISLDASIGYGAYYYGPLVLAAIGFLCILVIAARVSWLASDVHGFPSIPNGIAIYRALWILPLIVIASSFVAWCYHAYKASIYNHGLIQDLNIKP